MTKGILFIGDPHLSSRRPGRRTDASFMGTVLDKLDQALCIARNNDWQTVILGDLFDRAQDGDLAMLSRLLRLLHRHKDRDGATPLCLVGNHDLKDAVLTENTALSVVFESGLMEGLRECLVRVVPQVAILVAVPYGPSCVDFLAGDGKSLLAAEKQKHPDLPVIALTHGDYAFESAYPGAQEIVALPGVDGVVNGHMHKATPDVLAGDTLWMNPGNITRMSIDLEGEKPSVWSFDVMDGVTPVDAWRRRAKDVRGVRLGKLKETKDAHFLRRHVLEHVALIFDRTGMMVQGDDTELQKRLDERQVRVSENRFVELLKAESRQHVTEDGSDVWAEIHAVCDEQKVDPVVVSVLESLREEAV